MQKRLLRSHFLIYLLLAIQQQMAQMLGGDAKTFAAQRDDTYDKARDSKMYSGACCSVLQCVWCCGMLQCVCATKRVMAKCIQVFVLQRVAVSVALRHVAVCMCDKARDSKMYSCVCVAACCSECGDAACCSVYVRQSA